MNRQTVYPGTSLRDHVFTGDIDQMRQYQHLFTPVLDWLAARSRQLQADEDMLASFKEDAQPHLHVRAMKGARMDCDDIRNEIADILLPSE